MTQKLALYKQMVNAAVTTHCTWKIDAMGIIRRDHGKTLAIQEMARILTYHEISFTISDIANDVMAEIANREKMMQASIIAVHEESMDRGIGPIC